MIERRPRAPVLRSIACVAIADSASSVKVSLTSSISNRRWYCLTSAFFGSVRMLHQRRLVEIVERRDHRQTADEFGDQAELQQILRLDLAEDVAGAPVVRRVDLGAEADRGRPCRARR